MIVPRRTRRRPTPRYDISLNPKAALSVREWAVSVAPLLNPISRGFALCCFFRIRRRCTHRDGGPLPRDQGHLLGHVPVLLLRVRQRSQVRAEFRRALFGPRIAADQSIFAPRGNRQELKRTLRLLREDRSKDDMKIVDVRRHAAYHRRRTHLLFLSQ